MKTFIIKYIFLLSFFVIASLNGQSISIEYILNYKPSLESNKKVQQIYYLDLLNNESVFRTKKMKQSDSLKKETGYGLGNSTIFNDHLYIKKDLEDNTVYKFITMPTSMDKFNIKIEDSLNWKLTSDTKTISKLKCQKAEVEYAGRQWVAWFSNEINILDGPYVFKGLPGLIVQISDKDENYLFTLSKINKNTGASLFSDNAGKEISWDDFKKIQLDYYNDPFAYIKLQNIKAVTDDGMGGLKKLDFREMTLSHREKIKENDNQVEKNRIIKYSK
ncbi:GLPGLI family protein [Elizabethkingia miricola]|uniref:GLPGLI family protein n=1 Tax=Elizabethkingia bruuniana TaxID=1756149 RepID=UPI0009999CBB|nr:GLPGLI family protein [Elizabethkingia bruuniana]OPC59106.1 GLPGLI family protein [Elizabethkingia bruuniana]OPC64551.1 GLPGLI family protein [Elizabethkingia bruuniana]RBI92652.1 GLPGLI family protein [Elizabethkingia miricola]